MSRPSNATAEIVAWVTWAISFILILVVWSVWSAHKDAIIPLSVRRPFTNWLDVKNLFQNTTRYTPAETSVLEALLWNVSWCSLPTYRKTSTPRNRSASCVCLFNVLTQFLNDTKTTYANISLEVRDQYGSESLRCMSNRAPWRIEECGPDCFIHPMILTLYPNIVVFLLVSGYLILTRTNGWPARGLVACLGLGFAIGFWVINLRNHVIYIAIFAVITFSLTYALLQEFQDYSGGKTPPPVAKSMQPASHLMMVWPLRPLLKADPDPSTTPPQDLAQMKPHPVMICTWWAFLLVFPVYTIYIAISHATRDIIGVAVFGTMGYIAALMLQRYYWTFWYIQEKQSITYAKEQHGENIEIQWTLGYRTAYLFEDYPRIVLLVGTALTGVFLGVLSYAHGFSNSPFMSSTAIYLLTLGIAIMFGPVEIWNQIVMHRYLSVTQVNADDPYKPVSWIDMSQILSLSLANIVFASVVMKDTI
jgi:hypothetical protein